MTTKFGKQVCIEELNQMRLIKVLVTSHVKITWKIESIGRMVTYLDRLLPIKSQDLFITWSFKIT